MKFLGLIAASLLLLGAVASQPPQVDDAQWLKNLHRTYVGYTFGDGHVDSLAYDEEVREDGSKEPIRETHVRNVHLVYRNDVRNVKANYTSSNGFTGNVFWYSDQNGITTRRAGNSVPTIYAEDLVWTDAIATLPWHYLETKDIDGASVAVARVRLQGGMPIDLFVDRATGAYKRIEILGAGGDYQEEIDVKSYVEVAPGLRMIDSWRYNDASDYHTLRNFAVNPLVSDADLHPPAQTAQWSFSGGKAFPVEFAHHRILAHATINGVPGTFIVDTGADNIYLTGSFARRAHLTAMGHGESASFAGEDKQDVGRVSTLTLGDNTLTNVLVYYGGKTLDEFDYDGLLGYPVFATANVLLDFDSHSMTLNDPSLVPHLDDAVSIAGSFGDGVPMIPMALNKTLYFDMMLDTGNPDEIVFPYYLLPKYGLHLYRSREHYGVSCGTLDPLSISTLTYYEPTGCASAGYGRWILAGLDFLNQFRRIDFDYAGGTVVFVPRKK